MEDIQERLDLFEEVLREYAEFKLAVKFMVDSGVTERTQERQVTRMSTVCFSKMIPFFEELLESEYKYRHEKYKQDQKRRQNKPKEGAN